MTPSNFMKNSLLALAAAYASGVAAQYLPQQVTPLRQGAATKPAASIMKSVDARGRIVYSDRPIEGNKQIERMQAHIFELDAPAAQPVPANADPVTPSLELPPLPGSAAPKASLSTNVLEWTKTAQKQIDAATKSMADQANEKIAEANCATAKAALAAIPHSVRGAVRQGADGKHEYRSGEQLVDERERAARLVSEYCS